MVIKVISTRRRIISLLALAIKEKDIKGLDISIRDFDFLINQGGRVFVGNQPSVDDCYVQRLNYCGEKFKTLTERKMRYGASKR